MTDTETIAHPAMGLSIPESKQAQRRRLADDVQRFLDNGGRIKTDAEDVADDAEMGSDEVALYLSTNGNAISAALRTGVLFGVAFPQPKRTEGRKPIFATRDIVVFARRAQS